MARRGNPGFGWLIIGVIALAAMGQCSSDTTNTGGTAAVAEDSSSFGIADRLTELGIPFFFASGYGEQASLPMQLRAAMVVQKPCTTHNLANALEQVLP